MITKKTFEKLSIIFLIVIAILLGLMIAKMVPPEWFVYILGISMVLAIIYAFFRVYFIVQSKKGN